MGLDMWLYRRKMKQDEVAYWRKANEIHAWFERKFQEDGQCDERGIENCKQYYVSKEDLEELRDTCEKVLCQCKMTTGNIKTSEKLNSETGMWEPVYRVGKVIENKEYADELLPTQEGFFFGSTEYNEFYIEDLKNTIDQINKILEETDFDTEEIVYSAWW